MIWRKLVSSSCVVFLANITLTFKGINSCEVISPASRSAASSVNVGRAATEGYTVSEISSLVWRLCYCRAPWVRAEGRAWFSWPTVWAVAAAATLRFLPVNRVRLFLAFLFHSTLAVKTAAEKIYKIETLIFIMYIIFIIYINIYNEFVSYLRMIFIHLIYKMNV